jgi:hypothetical protein
MTPNNPNMNNNLLPGPDTGDKDLNLATTEAECQEKCA